MKKTLCSLLVIWLALPAPQVTAAAPPPPELATIQVLDLPTAQRIGLRANPNLSSATAAVEQARARMQQAAAAWWPSLDLNGSLGRTRLSDTAYQTNQVLAGLLGQGFDRTYDETTLGFQVTYLLFDGFAREFSQTIAELGEQTALATLEESQRQIALAIAEAFLNAQLAATQVEIGQANADFYAQQLRDARNRYQAGAGTHSDVINITIQDNAAKNELLTARWSREAAGYGLAALLGISEAKLPDQLQLASLDQQAALDKAQPEVTQLVDRALATRPDLRSLQLQLQSAEASASQQRGAFYPSVAAGYGLSGDNQEGYGLSGDDFTNTVGVNLSWNLFRGGADQARITEALAQKGVVAGQLRDLKTRVSAEVRQHLALLATARQQVELQRDNLALAQENRELAESEYEAGKAPLIRLNEAQRDLILSRGRLAHALVSCQLAQQRLLGATGENLAALAPEPAAAAPSR